MSDNTEEALASRPDGWVVVPRDLDEAAGGLAMLVAGKAALFSCSEDPSLDDARKCYTAMLSALPPAPQPE